MNNLSTAKGMNQICLPINMQDDVNTLTQSMMLSDNTIYLIKYDYDLEGEIISLPDNSILKFDGGILRNGTLILNKTFIDSVCSTIFSKDLSLLGECSNNTVDVAWFGAQGDGVEDDSDALQRTIDFASPFIWYGSVAETKTNMGRSFSKVVGNGTYRVTKSILLNPFVSIEGIKSGGFYENREGFNIIGDFDSKNQFVLDAAPYNTSGKRELGLLSSREYWDDGYYTGCPGWSLHKVNVTIPQERNIRGAVNRTMSMQSHISQSSFTGGNIGILSSTTWGGSIHNNNICARVVALANIYDVTIDDQCNNYLSISGSKPSTENFDYLDTSWLPINNPSCNLYNLFSHVNHYNNIWEGAMIGSITSGQRSLNLSNNYIEGSSYMYCYTFNTCDFSIKLGTTFCKNASLLYLIGASTNTALIDLSSSDLFTIKEWGDILWVEKIDILGSSICKRKMKYHPKLNLLDISKDGKLEIYMSQNGDDNNWGYSEEYPVRTLQEAVTRCSLDKNNIIIKKDPAADNDTKYHYRDGENVTTKVMNIQYLEIKGGGSIKIGDSYNERHSLPKGISSLHLNNMKFQMNNIAGDYQPLIPVIGYNNTHMDHCTIVGGTLIGCKWNDAGISNLSATDSVLNCNLVASGGLPGAFSWIDSARNSTTQDGNLGDLRCKKISSTLYSD